MQEVAHPDAVIKEIVQSRKFERSGTADALSENMAGIAALDKLAQGKATKFYIVGALGLVGGIFGFAFNGIAACILLAVGIFGIVKGVNWSRFDIADERHELTDKLLELVTRDSDPTLPISLKLGLGALNAQEYQITDPKIAVRSDRRYFEAEWLKLRGRFLDKTQYLISVTEALHIKHRKGKQKPKGFLITVVLAYPQKRYGGVSQLNQQAADSIKLPSGASLKSVRVTERTLRLCVKQLPGGSKQEGDKVSDRLYKTISMMLLSAYHLLNAGRAIDKSSGQASGG
jgi:hypothetical protein